MGESATDCEVAYETALWMLYAILDETMADGEPVKDEDRATVEKCACLLLVKSHDTVLTRAYTVIGSIRGRLDALRRKMRGR
jgi:serine/threonine-protein kinase ULK/ATG1